MGASLWDQVWLPLLIGLAIQIVLTALCSLSAGLWNCIFKQFMPQTAVEERDHDQPRSVGNADDAKALSDLEMGTVESLIRPCLIWVWEWQMAGKGRYRGVRQSPSGKALKLVTRRKSPCLARHLRQRARLGGRAPSIPCAAPLTPRKKPLWPGWVVWVVWVVSFSTPEAPGAAPSPAKKRRYIALYFTPVRSLL